MNIDWSKAPEGATHGREHQHGVDFYKREDGLWLYFTNRGKWDMAMGTNESSCESRPLLWNGEGLPPVGAVCEWAGCTFAPEDPREPDLHVGDQVTIIAHFKDGEFDLAAFTFNPQIHNPDRGTAWVNQGAHGCFRPIRTPEQIAAEEREAAIESMFQIACSPEGVSLKKAIGLIYDAGYKLQVSP